MTITNKEINIPNTLAVVLPTSAD